MSKRSLPTFSLARPQGLESVPARSALERYTPMMAASEGDDVITMLDVIGEDWWSGGGVTARRVDAALRKIGERDVRVVINSPGGDYFEGLAIYNRLREHPAHVTVQVIGLAASAASLIAMAGDEIQIGRAAFLMTHNCWVVAAGDRHGLRAAADWLEPFDRAANEIYAARTGLSIEEMAALNDAETWMSGADAIERGFADSLLPSDEEASPSASAETMLRVNLSRLHAALARDGMPRSERRRLLKTLLPGMPSAADGGTPSAALVSDLASLRDSLRAI